MAILKNYTVFGQYMQTGELWVNHVRINVERCSPTEVAERVNQTAWHVLRQNYPDLPEKFDNQHDFFQMTFHVPGVVKPSWICT
jgi:hypothetical protein